MDASVASPVHSTKDTHHKCYTTALPNIGIYDTIASTNNVLVGNNRGDLKQCSSVHSPFFPPKKGEKTEKCQRGLKTANIFQTLFIL